MNSELLGESLEFLFYISTDGFIVEWVEGLATLYFCMNHQEARQNVNIWPFGNETGLQRQQQQTRFVIHRFFLETMLIADSFFG